MRLHCGIIVSTVCFAATAAAQSTMGPIPGEEKFAATTAAQQSSLGAGLGVGKIGDDFFLKLLIRSELNLGPVGVGFQIPLNLRMPPDKEANDYYNVIRREDWDETSEYLRVIRYVRLGNKRDTFFLRVGELAAQIGHGTIMSRYMNNVDINTFRVGAQFDINTNYGGFETIVGNLGSLFADTPESRIAGMRAYLKPLALLDPESIFNIFALGVTAISDANAPATYVQDSSGNVETNDGNFVVDEAKALTVYGIDFEAELLHTAILDVIPYVDLNKIQDAGWGLHLGVLATAKMPIGFELTIPVRLEYRRFKENYRPIYFDSFYEIERYAYQQSGKPKGQFLKDLADADGISGYYGDVAFDFAGLLQFGAIYEDYEGGNPNLSAFLAVPALEVVQFKAYYSRVGIQGTNDILVFDDRSLAVAQGRYQIMPFLYAVGRFTRRWIPDPEPSPEPMFVAKDDWNFGVELDFNF